MKQGSFHFQWLSVVFCSTLFYAMQLSIYQPGKQRELPCFLRGEGIESLERRDILNRQFNRLCCAASCHVMCRTNFHACRQLQSSGRSLARYLNQVSVLHCRVSNTGLSVVGHNACSRINRMCVGVSIHSKGYQSTNKRDQQPNSVASEPK